MRIFCISDIHVDFPANKDWIKAISLTEYQSDALIVAGDVCDDIGLFTDALVLLKKRFEEVFFVPGNHDLWIKKKKDAGPGSVPENSIYKMELLLTICRHHKIRITPTKLGAEDDVAPVLVFPLMSWYDATFGKSYHDFYRVNPAKVPRIPKGETIFGDQLMCSFPLPPAMLADHFAAMNLRHMNLERKELPVITFSHFLSRPETLPPPSMMTFKYLPFFAGSLQLDRQIQQIKPSVHVFGHTHINGSKFLQGTWYVQNALRYPTERAKWGAKDGSLLEIWDTCREGGRANLARPAFT